jgi:hypothetical protein
MTAVRRGAELAGERFYDGIDGEPPQGLPG